MLNPARHKILNILIALYYFEIHMTKIAIVNFLICYESMKKSFDDSEV